jgi:hypothetical protein
LFLLEAMGVPGVFDPPAGAWSCDRANPIGAELPVGTNKSRKRKEKGKKKGSAKGPATSKRANLSNQRGSSTDIYHALYSLY